MALIGPNTERRALLAIARTARRGPLARFPPTPMIYRRPRFWLLGGEDRRAGPG